MSNEKITIVEYKDEHQPVFKSLNIEWLERFNLLEQRDLEVLDDPRGQIIDTGGVIYIALDQDEVVGTGAVIYEHGLYELAKMSVSPSYRGRGISKLLLERCLAFVRMKGASKVLLYSNSQLQTALQLYRRYGFKDVAVTDSPFLTADVKMELEL